MIQLYRDCLRWLADNVSDEELSETWHYKLFFNTVMEYYRRYRREGRNE